MHPETTLTTVAIDPDRFCGVVNPPVFRASTILFKTLEEFELADQGKYPGIIYGRYGTPTVQALEEAIRQLEGADHTIVTSSGASASANALAAFLSAGDHLLMIDTVYGPTRRLCDYEFSRLGIETTYYPPTIGADIAKLIKPNTKVVYLESPGSLTFEMQDIPAIAEAAHAAGAIVMADNTWATPLHMRAFDLGIDISIHSVTKYMAGHSDLVLGCISCKAPHYPQLLRSFRHFGACPAPDVCYLALRGLRTMAVRMKVHEENALKVARWLEAQPEVACVLHPALPGAPGHDLWKRDYSGSCGLFGFILKPIAHDKLSAMMNNLQFFGMGYSWGGYESLLTPVNLYKLRVCTEWAHQGQAMRIHIGLENVDELIADLRSGFDRLA